jgi:hypothetical protein
LVPGPAGIMTIFFCLTNVGVGNFCDLWDRVYLPPLLTTLRYHNCCWTRILAAIFVESGISGVIIVEPGVAEVIFVEPKVTTTCVVT